MKAESINILEKHRAHWLTLRDAGYIKQIEYKDKKELQDVFLTEIGKEHFNLWCGECVAIMIRRLYTTYESQKVQVTVLPPEDPKPFTPEKPGPAQVNVFVLNQAAQQHKRNGPRRNNATQ